MVRVQGLDLPMISGALMCIGLIGHRMRSHAGVYEHCPLVRTPVPAVQVRAPEWGRILRVMGIQAAGSRSGVGPHCLTPLQAGSASCERFESAHGAASIVLR